VGQASRQRRHGPRSGNGSASPKEVDDVKILAEDVDYQLASVATRREFDTRTRSLAADALSLFRKGGIDKMPGTPALTNQYDVVGWEYSPQNPVALVAHSLWHYGHRRPSLHRGPAPMYGAASTRQALTAPPWPRL
jgi:hypothetical protein